MIKRSKITPLISLCEKICLETKQIITDSPSRVGVINKTLKDKLEACRNALSINDEHYTMDVFNGLYNIAIKEHIGNCDEFAAVVAKRLAENGVYAEIFSVQYNKKIPGIVAGHTLLIINRNQQTDPTKPYQWASEEVVVFDPWDESIYVATQENLNKYLKVWYTDNQNNFMEDYDLSKHTLNCDFNVDLIRRHDFYQNIETTCLKMMDCCHSIKKILIDTQETLRLEDATSTEKFTIIQNRLKQLDDCIEDLEEKYKLVSEAKLKIEKNLHPLTNAASKKQEEKLINFFKDYQEIINELFKFTDHENQMIDSPSPRAFRANLCFFEENNQTKTRSSVTQIKNTLATQVYNF